MFLQIGLDKTGNMLSCKLRWIHRLKQRFMQRSQEQGPPAAVTDKNKTISFLCMLNLTKLVNNHA